MNEWVLAVSGLQPANPSDVRTTIPLLEVADSMYDNKTPLVQQQEKLLRKARYKTKGRAQYEE